MPRKKRVWQQEMCHHIMFRGVDGRALFFDDQDRIKFLLLLQEATELHAIKVHAFCLMTNHIHLILEPLKGSLSIGIHRFAGRYAQSQGPAPFTGAEDAFPNTIDVPVATHQIKTLLQEGIWQKDEEARAFLMHQREP